MGSSEKGKHCPELHEGADEGKKLALSAVEQRVNTFPPGGKHSISPALPLRSPLARRSRSSPLAIRRGFALVMDGLWALLQSSGAIGSVAAGHYGPNEERVASVTVFKGFECTAACNDKTIHYDAYLPGRLRNEDQRCGCAAGRNRMLRQAFIRADT